MNKAVLGWPWFFLALHRVSCAMWIISLSHFLQTHWAHSHSLLLVKVHYTRTHKRPMLLLAAHFSFLASAAHTYHSTVHCTCSVKTPNTTNTMSVNSHVHVLHAFYVVRSMLILPTNEIYSYCVQRAHIASVPDLMRCAVVFTQEYKQNHHQSKPAIISYACVAIANFESRHTAEKRNKNSLFFSILFIIIIIVVDWAAIYSIFG